MGFIITEFNWNLQNAAENSKAHIILFVKIFGMRALSSNQSTTPFIEYYFASCFSFPFSDVLSLSILYSPRQPIIPTRKQHARALRPFIIRTL